MHVIPSVGPKRGGPSRAMDIIARALSDQGVTVDVVTTDDNDDTRLDVPLGSPVQRAGATYHFFPRQLHAYGVSMPLRTWVRTHVGDFDIVHTHAVFSFAPTVAARAAHHARIPYVMRPLGTLAPYGLRQHAGLKQASLRLFDRTLLQNAAAIHCTSAGEAAEIKQLNPTWRTAVIPLGLELEGITGVRDKSWLLARAPQLQDRVVLLFLSRIDPKKGIDTLLEALAQVKASGVAPAVVIAGTGEPRYIEELQQKANNLGVQEDVTWLGHVSGTEKAGVLAAADAFVLPSKAENFGIAVAEALAAGLPVIVTNQVGIHNDITAAGAGIVTSTNASAFADAIACMLDQDTRMALSAQARPLAESKYSSRVMGEGLVALYHQILERDVHPRN